MNVAFLVLHPTEQPTKEKKQQLLLTGEGWLSE